jgi:hypothetical protein
MTIILAIIALVIYIIETKVKETPSEFYTGFVEFSNSPEGKKFANDYNKYRRQKRIAKAKKKQRKRQNRQTRNLIIAHQCVREVNKFAFGNKRR